MEEPHPMTTATAPDCSPGATRTSRLFRLSLLAGAAVLSACAQLPGQPGATPPAEGPRLVAQVPGGNLLLDQALKPETTALPPAAVAAPAPATPTGIRVPETVPITTAIDPLQPEKDLAQFEEEARMDLWVRVRRGFVMADLDDELVRVGEKWYASRPDYVQRMTERGSRYLFHVVEEIEKRNMPTELALLPFIESAFNPQAMSTARASGMWQFIPSTGKDYALKQNFFRDDRRDVLASTRAALDYLGRLHNMFGDWHLALAAYNWGEGNVQRAIARNQKAGLPTDYASLRMPDETRYYVRKLQAVENIVANPQAFSLSLPKLENHPYFLSVPIERDIDVDLAARLAGVSVEEFKQLNPQMNKPVILAAGTEQVLLPYDNANRFVHNLNGHKGQLATWTAWVAPKTLRPADAARQVGMSEAQLREVNRIPPRMLVKAGSTLLVPRTAQRQEDVSEHLADNAMMTLTPDIPPLRRVALRAGKRGETVASVARRYRTTPAQVAQWNKTSAGGKFAPGATIVVYVPQKATRLAAASTAPAKASSATSSKRPAAGAKTSRPVATSKASPVRAKQR